MAAAVVGDACCCRLLLPARPLAARRGDVLVIGSIMASAKEGSSSTSWAPRAAPRPLSTAVPRRAALLPLAPCCCCSCCCSCGGGAMPALEWLAALVLLPSLLPLQLSRVRGAATAAAGCWCCCGNGGGDRVAALLVKLAARSATVGALSAAAAAAAGAARLAGEGAAATGLLHGAASSAPSNDEPAPDSLNQRRRRLCCELPLCEPVAPSLAEEEAAAGLPLCAAPAACPGAAPSSCVAAAFDDGHKSANLCRCCWLW